MFLRVLLQRIVSKVRRDLMTSGNLLRIKETPPAFDTTELLVLPLLIEVLEVEVASAVLVCLADEGVQERLEVRLRSGRRAVALVADVAGCL